jgi:hypothetical protein
MFRVLDGHTCADILSLDQLGSGDCDSTRKTSIWLSMYGGKIQGTYIRWDGRGGEQCLLASVHRRQTHHFVSPCSFLTEYRIKLRGMVNSVPKLPLCNPSKRENGPRS